MHDSIYCKSFKIIDQMSFSLHAENALIDYLHVFSIQTMNFDLTRETLYMGLVAFKPQLKGNVYAKKTSLIFFCYLRRLKN